MHQNYGKACLNRRLGICTPVQLCHDAVRYADLDGKRSGSPSLAYRNRRHGC
ncbi:uncharacterized protein ASPGLDRAFT_43334 [Aspergillus glaucus CBS 516.65]|uniref:Uncharacterized protein n=1 Tax=Aspergillus glaucus CBS 516.65 TaxID=1160497 RepID=A0A1L9VSI8_ASPGL|nr:hypothetical protein ASPGLDRAFT_43334 [Aspergillus glaucus CBS 516.65]OJJ86877.1 hypothetical protein ASPGLDRAFT_43334 [Aspergillus glaucus CBS 516.65]